MTVRCRRRGEFSAAALLLLSGVLLILPGCTSLQEKRGNPLQRKPAVAPPLAGQRMPELGESATLDDYLTYALLNNPGLKSAFDRWIAALEKVPQARSLPDPSLGYGYFINSIETRLGPQRHRFELMQRIPFFGKLGLRGEAALAAAKAARARYEQERLNLLYRVKQAYYEYYYLGRAIQITEENVRVIERLEEVASARFRAGGAQQDELRAQVELGKLRDRLESLQDMRGAIAAGLNAELNRPIDSPVPWPRDVSKQKLKFTEQHVLQLARTGNWELKALSFEVEKSQKMLALAKKEFWPDFGVGVSYISVGEPPAEGMAPDHAGKDAVAAMLSVNVPIWRSRLYAGVKEAQASLTAAHQARQQKENTLLSTLRFALYRYNDAVRQMRLYNKTLIPKAKQALDASEEGYRAGKVDFVNIIDSERDLLAFRLAYERALADHPQRIAQLEMLVGLPLAEPAEPGETAPPGNMPRSQRMKKE